MNLDWLREWILEDPSTRVRLTLALLAVLLVLPLLGLSVYFWRVAARGDHPQLPPRTIRGFAIFFVIAAVGLVVLLWRFAVLINPPGSWP